MDWFQLHSREVAWASIAVVALVAGGWFYNRSKDLKAERAERAYYQAQRAVTAGNMPLAESDLKKMIARYDGTTASMGHATPRNSGTSGGTEISRTTFRVSSRTCSCRLQRAARSSSHLPTARSVL